MHKRSGKTAGNTKTIPLTISVWYDEKTEHIHLAAPDTDWFHSTINDREGSVRRHANLFRKLGKFLRDAGVPAPAQPSEASQTSEDDA
ncbi:MAG: hypothetical protein ACK4HG_12220 [Agrobacterium albertimagni]